MCPITATSMAEPVSASSPDMAEGTREIAALLGGPFLLGRAVGTEAEAHDLILRGIPSAALVHLLDGLSVLRGQVAVQEALGLSVRTLQRRKGAPERPLTREQSGRAWALAEVLTKAIAVFGSREEAERWLARAAMSLDERRPIDLLRTPAGTRLVDDALERLRFGVYT